MSVIPLPAGAQLSYNGALFDALHRSEISGKMTYDASGRSVVDVEWTLDVSAYVTSDPGASADVLMQPLSTRLTAPGKHLTVLGKGFDHDVNGPGPVLDVAHGVKPLHLNWKTLGADQAGLARWVASWRTPTCDEAVYKLAIAELTHKVTVVVGKDQYTTRHHEVAVRIAVTAQGRRLLPDHVDRYYERVLPPPVPGFERGDITKRVEANGSQMTFSFEDVEVPRAKPKHVSVCDLKWRVSSTLQGRGFTQWQAQLSGTLRVVAGLPPALAWQAFWLTLQRKLAAIEAHVSAPLRNAAPRANRPGELSGPLVPGRRFIFTDFSCETDVYDKDTRISIGILIFKSGLQTILRDSGMWAPVGTDWAAWVAGTYNRDGRGSAGIRERVEDVPLIDLCQNPPAPPAPPGGRRPADPNQNGSSSGGVVRPPNQGGSSSGGSLFTPTPGDPFTTDVAPPGGAADPDECWIQWWCELEELWDNHVVRHRPVGAPVQQRPPAASAENYRATARLVLPELPSEFSPVPDELQRVGGPSYRVVLRGGAIRASYPIRHPRLLRVGGVEAVEASGRFVCRPASRCGPTIVWVARWEIVYELPGAPLGPPPVPADPFLGIGA